MSSTEELLQEQLRLARKADRRGGCLWNIVLFLLFGVFYVAWLLLKQLLKLVLWLLRLVRRSVVWLVRKVKR